MTTRTTALPATGAKPAASRLSILFAGLLGLGIIFVVGHVQAGALHDAAHDVRHATGFPCH